MEEVVFTATNERRTIKNKVFGTTEATSDKYRENKGKNGEDQSLLLFETRINCEKVGMTGSFWVYLVKDI